MKTEVKVLIGFLLLGLLIAAISFFFARNTNEWLVKSALNHSESLRKVQGIRSKTMGAIQESLAYVLSGEKIEKLEYLSWEGDFSFSLKQFMDFDALHKIVAEGEKELTTQIITRQKRLSENAKIMFKEYE
jgi:hypothetical protein